MNNNNEVRAIPVAIGYCFELNHKAHGFKKIKVGDYFSQRFSGFPFEKIEKDTDYPIKFMVKEIKYIKNNKFHRIIRALFGFIPYKFNLVVEIVELYY